MRKVICNYCKGPILGWQKRTLGMHDGCLALLQDEVAERHKITLKKSIRNYQRSTNTP